jgi:hypothetical protein
LRDKCKNIVVSEIRELRRMFGPKREKVRIKFKKKMHN